MTSHIECIAPDCERAMPAETAEHTGGLCPRCFEELRSQQSSVVDSLEQLEESQLRHSAGADVASKLAWIVESCPDSSWRPPSDAERDLLSRSVALIRRVEKLGDSEDRLFVLKMMALGKLERFAEATAEARQAYEQNPGWETASGLAGIYRRSGDLVRAVEMLEAAAEHDRSDVTALLDMGDSHLAHQAWQSALDAYQRALEREPDQAWAVPSCHYCRYRLTGDAHWLEQLRTLANATSDECGVEGVLAQLTGIYSNEQRRERAQELLDRSATDADT